MNSPDSDEILIQNLSDFLVRNYKKNQHHVACVLRTKNKDYYALHLKSLGIDICAEQVAISNAIYEKNIDFDLAIAVYWDGHINHQPYIISPCGNCRQLLYEYAPGIDVLVDSGESKFCRVSLGDMLPYPYNKKSY